MSESKKKCNILKRIRKSIADSLGIDLNQKECTYEGECNGTCPKCESEERELNEALLKDDENINISEIQKRNKNSLFNRNQKKGKVAAKIDEKEKEDMSMYQTRGLLAVRSDDYESFKKKDNKNTEDDNKD